MKWLRKRVERATDENPRGSKATTDDRQAFVLFATGLLGRAPDEGSAFDDRVRASISATGRGNEGAALELLAGAIRDQGVAITLDELADLARFARVFDVHEDRWAFVGASVSR